MMAGQNWTSDRAVAKAVQRPVDGESLTTAALRLDISGDDPLSDELADIWLAAMYASDKCMHPGLRGFSEWCERTQAACEVLIQRLPAFHRRITETQRSSPGRTDRMNCNDFGRSLRSFRLFLTKPIRKLIMALAQDLLDAIAALDAKVTAHLDADGQAVAAMAQKLQDALDANTALQAQLDAALANSVTPAEKTSVLDALTAVGNRL